MIARRFRHALAALGAAMFWPALALADPLQDAPNTLATPAPPVEAASSRPSFVVTPIPLSNPAIGTGLAVAGMAFYGDPARPWTTGVGAMYTDSSSWAAGVFQRAHFDENKFRISAGGGYGDFHLDFYGIGVDAGNRGIAILLNEKGLVGQVDGLMQVSPGLYLGLRYRGIALDTTVDSPSLPFADLKLPKFQLDSTSSMLGLAAEIDTRDTEYNPHHGLYSELYWLFADQAFGSTLTYQRATIALNGYHALDPDTLIGWRVSLCWSGNGAPFYDLCNYGSENDLRGYAAGQYRDHAMAAAQVELRRHLFWRLGGVLFAGVGQVGPSFGDFNSSNMLPAAGFGLRFEVSSKYRVNLSLDFAAGKDSDAFYFYVGEAF